MTSSSGFLGVHETSHIKIVPKSALVAFSEFEFFFILSIDARRCSALQKLLNICLDLGRHGCGSVPLNRFAIPSHQEFREVPLDVFA